MYSAAKMKCELYFEIICFEITSFQTKIVIDRYILDKTFISIFIINRFLTQWCYLSGQFFI